MLDSIILDQKGIPSTPIITTVFSGSVTALAKAHGYQDFPLVIVKHPVAYISDSDLEERARDAARQIAASLVQYEGA